MDFSTIFDAFVNWQTLVLCLGLYLITFVIRTIIEGIRPTIKDSHYWRELFLPLGPIANGALIGAFAHMFPWPLPGISESLLARCFYGAICGMASGWVFARFQSWMKSKNAPNDPSNQV